MTDELSIWVVYDHPKDYPEHYVARRWVTSAFGAVATDDVLLNSSLERIHEIFDSRGLVRMHRYPDDDEKIVETWI